MAAFSSKRIVVTGGAGFLGQHLVRALQARGCRRILVPRSRRYDLRREAAVQEMYRRMRPEVVIHLAARVGGIGANQADPAGFLYDNLVMGAMLMEQARLHGVEKFVAIGTICAYPKVTPVPFREEELWNGYPEETNAPYGLAKKMLLVQAEACRRQHGFNAIALLPTNLYGPGDHFEPETSHVIPALIRKCLEAVDRRESEIVCWGDGTPTREFLYVEDCAEAIALATERYDAAAPVNIGSGGEISIRDLAGRIAELTGFQGRIAWDAGKPNGQPRRRLDTSRAQALFGFQAKTPLQDGLLRTIRWYQENRAAIEGKGP